MHTRYKTPARGTDVTASCDGEMAVDKAERVPIGPLQIDRVPLSAVPGLLAGFASQGSPHQIVTANLQFLGVASRDAAFAEIVNRADLVVADGVPLLGLSRIIGRPIPDRITGHDLLQIAAGVAAQRGYSIAFLGAALEVARQAARRLREMHPGLGPVSTHQASISLDGYGRSQQDERRLVDSLRLSRPHFLFVALGCPKQEFWIARHLHEVGVPVCVGVGGTLDVLAGRLKRAPRWMRRAGLEWSYRLGQEPQRLWKRYLLGDMPTLCRLGVAALSSRSRPRPAGGKQHSEERDRAAR